MRPRWSKSSMYLWRNMSLNREVCQNKHFLSNFVLLEFWCKQQKRCFSIKHYSKNRNIFLNETYFWISRSINIKSTFWNLQTIKILNERLKKFFVVLILLHKREACGWDLDGFLVHDEYEFDYGDEAKINASFWTFWTMKNLMQEKNPFFLRMVFQKLKAFSTNVERRHRDCIYGDKTV